MIDPTVELRIRSAFLAARPACTWLLAFVVCASALAHAGPTLLLRQPALSRERLAFVYAGDIWLANRDGSEPRQLTSHPASEFAPKFSPDGRWLAYSAGYDNNIDVYVIPVEGGQPRRLSWHPAPDRVNGWSADGTRVLFASPREVANSRSNQLFEVPLGGGFERKLMQAVAFEGTWSADGTRLAYQPYRHANSGSAGWRRSRGGTTPPVWIIDPATQAVEKIPHVNATDRSPQWDGGNLYFISDRSDGAANVFAYDAGARSVRQLSTETVWDVRNFAVQGGTIVYEAGGELKETRVDGGATRVIPVTINAPAPQARPQWKDATRTIVSTELSPSGKRVLLSARGEVFTVPVKDGSTRNLTRSAGVREKDALWSPDGTRIAWITDAGMRHVLQLRDQAGLEEPQSLPLGERGYFELLGWSPDGRRIVYHDNHLNLYALDTHSGDSRRIDSSARRAPFQVAFAPGGRWLAYTVRGANHFSQIKLHDFDTGRTEALTDGLSHAGNPVFGTADYLYFTASINSGPAQVSLDMSTQERPLRSGIYAAVLAADGASPLAPRTADEGKDDDGKPQQEDDEGKDEDGKKPVLPVRIDLAGIQDRLVALPVAERNYDSLRVAHDGSLYYLERRQPGSSLEPPEAEAENNAELYRFDFKEREAKSLARDLAGLGISADGKQLLLRYAKGKLKIAEAGAKLKPKEIELSGMRVLVDPREEWRQIFEETCWMEQEFFYDPGMHGLDWQATCARYRPLLAHVQRREDLNELLVDLIGELQVAHNNVLGGDIYQEEAASTGLLGADFEIVEDRYRIRTLYRGDRWNPFLKAPLAAPGLGVREGDFLLAVNGEPLDATRNLFQLLGNTAGKQVALTIAADAHGKDARTVTVVPVESEADLRQWQWIEHNRQYVQERSGGKVAYVYLPDTHDEGFRHFNRMFFSQIDKQAVIIDERCNGGGQAANYVVEVLARKYLAGWKDRDGLIFSTPGGAIYGPKLMLIDQDAGSGGDFLPYAFKRLGLGTLLGTRTWGGLIGIAANPALIDGGTLTVPFFRFFTPEGEWAIENEGVAPDIEVELEPDGVNRGIDTQLDRAIAEAMRQLEGYTPVERQSAPAMPTVPGS